MTSTPALVVRTFGDHLTISPTRWLNPDASDFWDGNWLSATIDLRVGAFRASYEAQLRNDELRRFREQLGALYERLSGTAKLEPLETWIGIEVVGDGKGHFIARCKAQDYPGITGSTLTFKLEFDQTDVPRMLRELDAMLAAFPVRGAPP